MRGRDKFDKVKAIISVTVAFFRLFPSKIRICLFYKARYRKGYYGIFIRYSLLKSIAKTIGSNVLIGEGVFLLNPQKIKIGDNVSIQPMSYIECLGGLTIGSDVSIAHGVTIMTTSHKNEQIDIPIKDQDVICKSVSIGNNVWIGAKATILCGNSINEGAIVGAGAVVTKTIQENTVVAGVPAKLLRRRD